MISGLHHDLRTRHTYVVNRLQTSGNTSQRAYFINLTLSDEILGAFPLLKAPADGTFLIHKIFNAFRRSTEWCTFGIPDGDTQLCR